MYAKGTEYPYIELKLDGYVYGEVYKINPEQLTKLDEKYKRIKIQNNLVKIENFFGIMEQEIYYSKINHSFKELEQAVNHYIDIL